MNERVAAVATFATAIADKYISARQKLAILEPLIGPEITALYQNAYGAHAHEALALTLILDLVRDICAFALDSDRRAASLVTTWRRIQNADLRAALRDKAAKPYKRGNTTFGAGYTKEQRDAWLAELDAADIAEKGASFDESFTQVAKELPSLVESDLATKMLKARNKTIAHYEMKNTGKGFKLFPLSEIGLKWGDPKAFMQQLDPILWNVVLLATWGSYDVEGYERQHKLYALDFWARLQGKPPIDHVD